MPTPDTDEGGPGRFTVVDDASRRTLHHVIDSGPHDRPRPTLIASGDGHELEAIVDVLNADPDAYDRALRILDEEEPF